MCVFDASCCSLLKKRHKGGTGLGISMFHPWMLLQNEKNVCIFFQLKGGGIIGQGEEKHQVQHYEVLLDH